MRVAVVGSSGSGKTTLARGAAERLGVPCVELDAIYHQQGWTALSDDEFRARVAPLAAADRWVIDGNYRAVRPTIFERADVIVWLDFNRATIMSRVIRRSALRAVTRAELWNGNRESFARWVRSDHPIRWTWSHFSQRRKDMEQLCTTPGTPHIERLRRPRDARRWLDGLLPPVPPTVGS